jgi:capsular polysaccharide biosynthesis protein
MVNTIQFCDRATPPEKKSKPKKIIISILVGFATLFVMMFTAFVREYWQNTTNSADEAEAHRMRQLSSYAQKWRGDALTFLSWFKRKKLR